ncbi:hypothetical protein ACRAWD_21720 [Caulobacter segnis]
MNKTFTRLEVHLPGPVPAQQRRRPSAITAFGSGRRSAAKRVAGRGPASG